MVCIVHGIRVCVCEVYGCVGMTYGICLCVVYGYVLCDWWYVCFLVCVRLCIHVRFWGVFMWFAAA